MSHTAEFEARMGEIVAGQEKPRVTVYAGGGSDKELDHVQADKVLTDALRFAGFDTLVDLYERIDKWYA